MNLFFGNLPSVISTVLVIGIMIFAGTTIINRSHINKWGTRVLILALWGLLICVFVAIRDDYVLSVQASMDTGVESGLFALDSIQSTICCIAGAIIAFCSITSIFIRKQKYWKLMFYILSVAIVFKILVIEISRIVISRIVI